MCQNGPSGARTEPQDPPSKNEDGAPGRFCFGGRTDSAQRTESTEESEGTDSRVKTDRRVPV